MADKQVKAAETSPAEKKTVAKKRPVVGVTGETERPQKVEWTLKRVQKYARRFASSKDWSESHPSSWKAALAHGWDKKVAFKSAKQTRSLPLAG
ncbi:MAG: hypothetical protein WCI18_09825 [Pseudomonadota bacterium]